MYHKDLIKWIIILFAVYFISLLIINSLKIKEFESYRFIVSESRINEDYTTAYGKINMLNTKININKPIELKPGDILEIKGELKEVEEVTIPGNFNYKGYLKSKKILNTISVSSYTILGNNINLNTIRYNISSYIEKTSPSSSKYIKTFVLADKSEFDQSLKRDISSLGLSHLFAVSGMHVGLIVFALIFILKKMNINTYYQEKIVIVFLILFLFITGFTPSVIRAVLMYIFIIVNKKFNLGYSNLDILSFLFILLLIINPYFYLNPGFTLSFLVTLTIILSNNLLKYTTKTNQLFLIGLFSMLITLPIVASFNNSVNLLGLFANVLFIFIVTYVILPLSFITLIFPIFDSVFYKVIVIFESLIAYLSEFKFLVLNIAFTNELYVIFFYCVLLLWFSKLEQKEKIIKYTGILILTIFVVSFSNNFSILKSVNFMDVNGDSTVIVDSFNRCNIVIDTGEYDNYDRVIKYLKSKNIKKIDFFIITHNHSDHYGEFDDVISSFKVRNIITSYDDDYLLSNNIKCGSIDMYIYPSSKMKTDENNSSVVLVLKIGGKNYLFTGDIEKDREKELLMYSFPDIDFLKVAHHGSITSSTNEFINHISPKNAVIIVARNNRHNHPSIEIVERLKSRNIKTTRTDILGTIEHIYIFGKEFQRYNPP